MVDMPPAALSYPQRLLLVEGDQGALGLSCPVPPSAQATSLALLSVCELTLTSSEHREQHTLPSYRRCAAASAQEPPGRFPA